MKVWQRVIVKTLIFLLAVAAAGGGVAAWRAWRQSTAEYAMNRYLTLLIEDSGEKAYALLDQSEEEQMTSAEYVSVLETRKYSLYSSYNLDELETRRDSSGNEYVDFQAEFMDADQEVQATESFSVKKQSEATFGIFDQWKILSEHCMIKNFLLTVPSGAEVYLDGEKADTSWITENEESPEADCYQIPSLLPGTVSLVIRHSILESVNTTFDPSEGSADFCDQMPLKESAKSECLEIGINALKELYAGAATGSSDKLDELLEACMDEAEAFVEDQSAAFTREDIVFKTAAISAFETQFTALEFSSEENRAITTEMTLIYHYVVQQDITTYTEEYDEEGNPVQQTDTQSESGENTAKFKMAFYDDEWHVEEMEVPTIGYSTDAL